MYLGKRKVLFREWSNFPLKNSKYLALKISNEMKNNLFKYIFIMSFLLIPIFGFSQEVTLPELTEEAVYELTAFDYLLFFSAGFLLIFVLYSLLAALRLWVRMKELEVYEANGLDAFLKERERHESSWFGGIYEQLMGIVPLSQEQDILLSHNYDGIQELDNNLPPWWLYGFYLTILIAIVYMGIYHFSSHAKSSAELYEIEMAAAQKKVDAYIARQANSVDETNVTALVDPESIGEGKSIFEENCVACHLASGAGSSISVGPNLTDEYWLHGGGIKDIFKTVKNGVPEKGMIAWKTQMRPADIHKVSSYILTLQGTSPGVGKEPQGELYVEKNEEEPINEEATESTDSEN